MGIDYTAIFGIGYKITSPIDENDESTYRQYLDYVIENMYDFGKFIRKTSKYWIDKTGDDVSGDEEDHEWYIFLKEPFENDFNLMKQQEELLEYCNDMKIEIKSKFDLHGGLYID